RAVAAVQILDLLQGEIVERQPRAYVERRLVDIRDEEVRFRGISNHQRETAPGTVGIGDALVVPGAQQAEYLGAEVAGGEYVYLVQPPHQVCRDPAEHLAPH